MEDKSLCDRELELEEMMERLRKEVEDLAEKKKNINTRERMLQIQELKQKMRRDQERLARLEGMTG